MHMEAKLRRAFFIHMRFNPNTPEKEKLPRKVVSSHLQVEKAKFKGAFDPNNLIGELIT